MWLVDRTTSSLLSWLLCDKKLCSLRHYSTSSPLSSLHCDKKRCPLKMLLQFQEEMKSDGDKSGLSGGWSKTVNQRLTVAVICVLVRSVQIVWEENLLHVRMNSLNMYLQFSWQSNIALTVNGDASRHEFWMHYTINIPDSSEYNFPSRRSWISLVLENLSKSPVLRPEIMHPAFIPSTYVAQEFTVFMFLLQ